MGNAMLRGSLRVRIDPPGKNILNCENAVEIKVIGQLALWNDEFQING